MRGDYSFLKPSKPMPELDPPLKVGIVPTPDFTLMSLSCFVEFLRLSGDESDFSRKIYCSWELLSHSYEPVRASCGFPIVPTKLFGDPVAYDYVVVLGGILHSARTIPEDLYNFVRTCVERGSKTVGLCTGQFVLAELGYMTGRRCAVHFSLSPAMTRNFPDVIPVTDAPVVVDGDFITCPGGLAAINLAMYLVTNNCGKVRSHKALHYLMADRGFEEMQAMKEDEELGLHSPDRRVVNAVGMMRQKMLEPGSLVEIARAVGATERQLTRLFRKHLRSAPADYWRRMRLNAARWMILNSDRSVTQIAYECGFSDSSHLIHWFKSVYNVTPAKLRRLRADLGVH
jgi:transcriptional regulator GlxA family with amidase domain